MYRLFFKRILDILIASIVLLLVFPLFLLTGIILLIQNKGSVFFFQSRPGKDHKKFFIVKFKSMNDRKNDEGHLLPDIERITPFGNFIRKYSIDELPQLLNVLKGDMSLIGPRPLLFKYLPLYSTDQDRRHEVKPGITGWAQVNGRNSISWTKKFELDIYYIDHMSFLLDLKIFYLTFLKVVNSEGVNQTAERPMQPFNGKN
jgi:lipopolysaccharide/colanic/teichoic acid biosynthesis glycosyltransferase